MEHEEAPRRGGRVSHRLAVVGTVAVMAVGTVLGTGLSAGAATPSSAGSSGFHLLGLHIPNVLVALFGHHPTFKPPKGDDGCLHHKPPPYDGDHDEDDEPHPCPTPTGTPPPHHHHHHHHHHEE